MRYIGSKQNLLGEIEGVINRFESRANSFCDIFSGTACVARYFKKDYQIISNDLLYFSYAIQRATVKNQSVPSFQKLRSLTKKDPFVYLAELDHMRYHFKTQPFIYEQYSPNDNNNRQYLTNENALRIDMFRQTLNDWHKEGLIDEDEFFYLLAGIVEAVPWVSNIAGTYGAYLKHWDKRAFKTIAPVQYPVYDNAKDNQCFNRNANDLIKSISGDILYLDPPYNGRQYISNYHLLETIARYDNPSISGVTGTRKEEHYFSDYCKKTKVLETLRFLVADADFKFIVLSYSNEGIMAEEEIVNLLSEAGNKKSLQIQRIPYRRYKRTIEPETSDLNELIFSIEK